jgi:cell wall-associated NlpC family hydrolase
MSTTTIGSVVPSVVPNVVPRAGFAVPRRLVSMLTAALLGLALALNPMSAPKSDAAVPLSVSLAALRVANAQIGIPYRYGGMSRAGFDCSGLTKYSYAKVGRYIPRTAQQQYNATIHIPANSSQRRAGDLVFFYSGRTIYHVGVYAGNWYMIAAPHTGTLVRRERIWSTHIVFGRVR